MRINIVQFHVTMLIIVCVVSTFRHLKHAHLHAFHVEHEHVHNMWIHYGQCTTATSCISKLLCIVLDVKERSDLFVTRFSFRRDRYTSNSLGKFCCCGMTASLQQHEYNEILEKIFILKLFFSNVWKAITFMTECTVQK